MPDHIHFVLQVTEYLEKPVGKYIAPFTKNCSQAYTNNFSLSKFTTLFKPFDDEIIFNHEQLDRAIKYVEDNPRRYLIRKQYPDIFKRHLHIVIDGHEYAAYGNIFLLKGIWLLLLAPWPDNLERRSTAGYTEFHKMNDHAASIAALPASARLSLRFDSNSQ